MVRPIEIKKKPTSRPRGKQLLGILLLQGYLTFPIEKEREREKERKILIRISELS